MSELESGSATVGGGGGRGDAIILTLYVLVVFDVSRCRVEESGATQFSCLYTVKKQKFISLNHLSVLTAPFYPSFPTLPPPPPPQTPDRDVK